jgi:pimeloyl-ACP methyl ester carboxylesterase
MSITNRKIKTSHADIAISETSGNGLPIVFLHGTSSCKEIFRHQLESSLGDTYRMVAIDFPGHGESSNAVDPARTYCMPGYADMATEILGALGIRRAVVVGWSLGGHVGIEMLALYPGMIGLMIAGTPPVRRDMEAIQQGFKPSPALLLVGKEDFTEEDFETFGRLSLGDVDDPVLRQALRRTHGAARRFSFESLVAGRVSDQRDLAENSDVPIAVVNGADDPIVNLDYIGSLNYRNLWDEHCYVLRGLGHIPFYQAPEVFNPILTRFQADMEKRAAKAGEKGSSTRRSGTYAA